MISNMPDNNSTKIQELGKGTLQNRLKLLKILVEKVEEKRLEKVRFS